MSTGGYGTCRNLLATCRQAHITAQAKQPSNLSAVVLISDADEIPSNVSAPVLGLRLNVQETESPRATDRPQIQNLPSVPLASSSSASSAQPPLHHHHHHSISTKTSQRPRRRAGVQYSIVIWYPDCATAMSKRKAVGHCLRFLVPGSGVRNTGAIRPGRRLSACRVLWRLVSNRIGRQCAFPEGPLCNLCKP